MVVGGVVAYSVSVVDSQICLVVPVDASQHLPFGLDIELGSTIEQVDKHPKAIGHALGFTRSSIRGAGLPVARSPAPHDKHHLTSVAVAFGQDLASVAIPDDPAGSAKPAQLVDYSADGAFID